MRWIFVIAVLFPTGAIASDICTLPRTMTCNTNLITKCVVGADGNQYCTVHGGACEVPKWQCRRDDGSSYEKEQSRQDLQGIVQVPGAAR